ncbi:MAG: hypothetical protein P4M11_13005 [Candidatus Pacebacteria bacterium]|nr:hypothetical protein [Candidatus Paceibacterota bacterium]
MGSSCKINGVSPRALDSEKVAEQVAAMAPAEGRITFAAALKWCATDKATTQLFTFIDNPEQKC